MGTGNMQREGVRVGMYTYEESVFQGFILFSIIFFLLYRLSKRFRWCSCVDWKKKDWLTKEKQPCNKGRWRKERGEGYWPKRERGRYEESGNDTEDRLDRLVLKESVKQV